jgi:MFS transporter, DHA1 family, solute carrier family 18 (vesicular amine transporter), member 1/2
LTKDAVTGRNQTWTILGVVAFALFLDYFLYGTVIPLTPALPGVKSEAEIGILYGAYAVSVLVAAPLFGHFGDRVGSRTVMIYGAGLAIAATVLFGLAPNFYVLLLARLCKGAASAATWTAGLGLIAEHYAGRRVEMMGYAFTGSTAGSILGPVVSGMLYRVGGYRMPFAVTALLFVIELCLLIFILPAGAEKRQAGVRIWTLVRNKPVLTVAIAVLLAAFGWGTLEALLPAHLTRYGASVETIGILFTVSAVVYGLFAPVVGRASERFPARKVMAAGAVALAATLPGVSVFRRAGLAAVALCVVNVSFAFLLNPASAELANAVDRAGMTCYSTVYAIYNIAYSLGMIAASGKASLAAGTLGFRGTLVSASAVLLATTLWLVLSGNWMAGESPAPAG